MSLIVNSVGSATQITEAEAALIGLLYSDPMFLRGKSFTIVLPYASVAFTNISSVTMYVNMISLTYCRLQIYKDSNPYSLYVDYSTAGEHSYTFSFNSTERNSMLSLCWDGGGTVTNPEGRGGLLSFTTTDGKTHSRSQLNYEGVKFPV